MNVIFTILKYALPIAAGILFFRFIISYLKRHRIRTIEEPIFGKEKYKKYRKKYYILIAIYILVSALFTYLLSYSSSSILKKILLTGEVLYSNLWYITIPLISILVSLFVSLLIFSLIFEKIGFLVFPDVLSKSEQKALFISEIMLVIGFLIILIVPGYLVYNTYDIINDKEIIRNSFGSLYEERYKINDIDRIIIDGGIRKVTLYIKVFVVQKDGFKYEIWDDSPNFWRENNFKVIEFFKNKEIPIILEREPTDEEYSRAVDDEYQIGESREAKKTRAIMERLKTII